MKLKNDLCSRTILNTHRSPKANIPCPARQFLPKRENRTWRTVSQTSQDYQFIQISTCPQLTKTVRLLYGSRAFCSWTANGLILHEHENVEMSHAPVLAAAALMLLLSGCALFEANKDASSKGVEKQEWFGKNKETDTGLTLNTARLEATIVTRPANDERIRKHAWMELDECGLMRHDQRQHLNQTGFRVAVASGTAPWALESLAREAITATRSTDGQAMQQSSNDKFSGLGPAFNVMLNSKSVIEVQSQLDASLLQLNEIPELASLRDQSGLRCIMEVSVKELTNDMALLSVLPQIHSGTRTSRLSVSGSTEQLPVRQNILPLYDQQFTVRLHSGDMVVIGQQRSESWNSGRLFFEPYSGSMATERLLLIRLAGVDQMKGQSDSTFRLGAYDKR